MKIKKRAILISLLIGLPIISSAASFVVTFSIMQKRYDDAIKVVFETHYSDRCKLFEEENKHITNIDVAFIGDSLTEGYDVKTYYPQYNVINRGIGGDTTFGVEKRLKVSAYDAHPKVATLLIGANNFDTMMDNYENILRGFKENIPETKIVLLSLTSMAKEWDRNNEKAQANNVKIKAYAEQYDFTFVDLYNPLLDPDTNKLKLDYTTDGGHLTALGYEKVTSVITPVLDSLLS